MKKHHQQVEEETFAEDQLDYVNLNLEVSLCLIFLYSYYYCVSRTWILLDHLACHHHQQIHPLHPRNFCQSVWGILFKCPGILLTTFPVPQYPWLTYQLRNLCAVHHLSGNQLCQILLMRIYYSLSHLLWTLSDWSRFNGSLLSLPSLSHLHPSQQYFPHQPHRCTNAWRTTCDKPRLTHVYYWTCTPRCRWWPSIWCIHQSNM